MVNLRVGDTVTFCVALKPFCGVLGSQFYMVHDLDCAVGNCPISSFPYSWDCLTPSGVSVEFQWTNYISNSTCDQTYKLKILGTSTTNSVGIATIQYKITQSDLDIYNIDTTSFYLRVCFNNDGTENKMYSDSRSKADNIVIQPALKPTHYVELQLALLQSEASDLIEQNISTISTEIPILFGLPPSPWTYINTTFDKTNKKLILWYNNSTVTLGISRYDIVADIMGLLNFIWTWLPAIIAAIFGIIATAIAIVGGAPLWIIVGLFTGAVIVTGAVISLITQKEELKKEVTNLEVANSQIVLPVKIKERIVYDWSQSDKSNIVCLNIRLDGYKKAHIEYIVGYKIKYPNKLAGFYTEIDAEIQLFSTNADTIISEFNQQTYSVTVCDTYYVRMDTEVSNSSTRVNAIIVKYITEGIYTVKCPDFVTSGLCTKSGCMWYYGKCIDKSDCLIVEPFNNTCILKTGDIVMGGIIGIGALTAIYYIPPLLSIGSNYLADISKEQTKSKYVQVSEQTSKKQV